MLNFSAHQLRYEPYPLVVLKPALPPEVYNELCENFPETALFRTLPKYDYKLSLSEKFNPEGYKRFIQENKPWNRFHAWLKSDDFIRQTVEFLKANNIDLDVDKSFETSWRRFRRAWDAVKRGHLPALTPRLRSRFEFSVLKADGGEVAPHTDTPKKIITFVLSMIRDGEWDTATGGGLEVARTRDTKYAFNWNDRQVPWDRIEEIDTVPFVANQCIIFVKTFNSLHAVRKMTAKGSNALRKTVTIVIARDE
jgi:hypothetical protein